MITLVRTFQGIALNTSLNTLLRFFLQFFFEYSKGMAEETKTGVCKVLDDVGGKVLDWNGCMEITHMVHD